jgi:CRP/FNR family transcriptional regulator, cyclic AMP receptor protein
MSHAENRGFEIMERCRESADPRINFPDLDDPGLSSTYKSGTVLFREGQEVRGVYLVRTGSVKLSVSSAQGKVIVLRVARPGDWVGLSSALKNHPQESSAETISQSRLTFLSLSAFTAAMATRSEFNQSVLAALNHDLLETIALIRMVLLSKSAEEKLARLLIKWCDDSGVREPDGIRIEHTFTQYQIAEMISVSRETVTRILSDFSRRGVIRLESDSFLISSRSSLASLVSCEESIDR